MIFQQPKPSQLPLTNVIPGRSGKSVIINILMIMLPNKGPLL